MTLDYGPVTLGGRPRAVNGAATMYAPRRTVLDHLLLKAAQDAGAEVREQTTLTDLHWDGDRVSGARLRHRHGAIVEETAKIVVGADGMHSRVARLTGAGYLRYEPPISCVYLAYWRGVAGDGVEFYMRKGRLILVFPTHDDLACVYVGWPNSEFEAYRRDVAANYRATLDLAPDLARRIDAGERVTPFKGTHKLPNHYRQAAGPGWALAGDAAYHRDPTTGFGISDAFLGAELLAEAIDAGLAGKTTMAAATAAYGKALRARTEAQFELTLRSAQYADPRPMHDFYRAVAEDPHERQRLFDVVGGLLPYTDVFNGRNIRRLSQRTTRPAAMGGLETA